MKNVPWSEVPDTNILPDAIVSATLESLEKRETKARDDSPGGKLMYMLTARIKEPKALKGMQVFDNYVVGTDDDPDAEELDTIRTSIGVKRMKRTLKAAGADLDTNAPPLKIFKTIKGKEVLFEVAKVKQTEGRFKGSYNNNVVAVYAMGEEEPRLLAGEDGAEEEDRPSRGARKPVRAKPEAEEEEESGEEETAEEPPRARRIARAAAPEPVTDEEEEPEEEPVRPAKTASAGGKAKAKKSDPVKCSACGKLVERADFDDHLEEAHADEG